MDDWASEAADTVERVVTTVRDKTVEPARQASRYVIYGLFVAILAGALFLMASIAFFRLLNVWLPVWASYVVLGAIFVVVGGLLWVLRSPRTQGATP